MKAVDHYGSYSEGLYREAFTKTTARGVTLGILMGEIDLVSGEGTPQGCLMIQGALATGPESEAVQQAMARLRRQAEADVAARFAQFEEVGQLPTGWTAKALAGYVITVATGMAVQAKSGASRQDLVDVAHIAMKIWPGEREGTQRASSIRDSHPKRTGKLKPKKSTRAGSGG
jgi:hypothetical protein